MKSVIIRDAKGLLLIKILKKKKTGEYEFTCSNDLINKVTIDVRDDNGCKIYHDLMRIK